MKQSKFPNGWNEARIKSVIDHYEMQSEEEAVIEDETEFDLSNHTFMEIPIQLVPKVRELIANYTTAQQII
ncbi:hypothetical protein TI05_05730 [Achromatium sp. WMS3]|nr:hypothetical protein TI05_05730 [Achromatium sp. WMS3]